VLKENGKRKGIEQGNTKPIKKLETYGGKNAEFHRGKRGGRATTAGERKDG